MFSEDSWRNGHVVRVGKATGRDKNTCWIRNEAFIEEKINFATEIEDWQYMQNIKKVTFSNDVEQSCPLFIEQNTHKRKACRVGSC